ARNGSTRRKAAPPGRRWCSGRFGPWSSPRDTRSSEAQYTTPGHQLIVSAATTAWGGVGDLPGVERLERRPVEPDAMTRRVRRDRQAVLDPQRLGDEASSPKPWTSR